VTPIALVGLALLLFSAGFALTLWKSPSMPEPVDPGLSPVSWLSEDIWRSWNQYADPDGTAPIILPRVRTATEADRDQATVLEARVQTSAPSTMTANEATQALLQTPGVGFSYMQNWPMCCGHLGTMLSLTWAMQNAADVPFRFLEDEVREDWPLSSELSQSRAPGDAKEDLEAFFQCTSCGRLYVGSRKP